MSANYRTTEQHCIPDNINHCAVHICNGKQSSIVLHVMLGTYHRFTIPSIRNKCFENMVITHCFVTSYFYWNHLGSSRCVLMTTYVSVWWPSKHNCLPSISIYKYIWLWLQCFNPYLGHRQAYTINLESVVHIWVFFGFSCPNGIPCGLQY
jgi:hypothetical protein